MISKIVLRTQPDGKLALLASQGSEAAFEALVKRYRPVLHAYCGRLLLSESTSEDVVQQAFINAWSALTAGAEVRELRPWLFRITHNQAISALRRPGYDFDELSESLCATAAPDSDLERRTLMRETLAAVAALPELQREAILRTAVNGYSYEEAAAALGITDEAVRGLVYRARTSLRQGVAAFAPAPLVLWAAGQAQRAGLASWIGEAVAGGGSAGAAAIVLKGAGVLATSAVVLGGTVGGAIKGTGLIAAVPHAAARTATAQLHASHAPTRAASSPALTRTASAPASGVSPSPFSVPRASSPRALRSSVTSGSAGGQPKRSEAGVAGARVRFERSPGRLWASDFQGYHAAASARAPSQVPGGAPAQPSSTASFGGAQGRGESGGGSGQPGGP